MRARIRRGDAVRVALIFGILLLSLPVRGQAETDQAMRQRGLLLLRSGDAHRAKAVFDSLLTRDLTDLTAGYLAAQAELEIGQVESARCRWLEVEGAGQGERIGLLAAARRRWREQEMTDALIGIPGSNEVNAVGGAGLALLPLESLGGGQETPYLGLAWSYLLFDALGGTGLCPVSIPTMLLVQDRVTGGRGVRVPSHLARRPVNTVNGIRLRLSLLPRRDGGRYLLQTTGDWDSGLREAILEFQRDESLTETGEADLATQERLESRLDRWVEQPPPPLLPSKLGAFLRGVGANLALRGSYRREGESILVEMSVISSEGQAIHSEPIRRRFSERDLSANAFDVAREITRIVGGRSMAWKQPAPELGINDLESATAVLMRMDRGAFFVEPNRWTRLSSRVFDWEFASSAREISRSGLAEIDRWERLELSRWIGRIRLDPEAALSGWFDQLGDRLGGGSSGPGAVQVLGDEGRIRVRGSGP